MSPRVSISIPTYKGANFIAETIESVLSQEYQDFEILVFDDASPDETRDIVLSIKDDRISYFRNDSNLGPEGNWNLGLKKAKGLYYKLLPHDDLLSRGALGRQVKVLEDDEAESIALVFGGRDVIGPDSRKIMSRSPFGDKSKLLKSRTLINRCIASGTNIIGEPGNGLNRTALLKKVTHYDARYPYTVDLNFWFRLLKHGDAYYTGKIDSAFRLHPQSWSNHLARVQSQDFANTVKLFSIDSDFKISKLSQNIGRMKAPLNAVLRKLFYATYFKS